MKLKGLKSMVAAEIALGVVALAAGIICRKQVGDGVKKVACTISEFMGTKKGLLGRVFA